MAHAPKTVYGYVILFLFGLAVVPLLVSAAVALSGPLVWAALAAVALMCVALFVWRRRADAARERAWVGSFSFGDVVARMRAKEALRIPAHAG